MEAVLDKVRSDSNLQLKTQAEEFDGMVEGLTRVPWRSSYVLDLPSNPEELQMGDSHKRRHRIRWALKKAMRSGVQVRIAESENELKSWYELYLDTMRRKIVPPRPYRLFHVMWQELRQKGRMQLLLAEKYGEGKTRLLAGSIFLMLGGTVFYAFTGCRREDFSLHPHDLIQWQAIQTAAKKGYRRYDFGEVADDSQSLANFKSKWGAEEKRLHRFYYPAPKSLARTSLPVAGWPTEIARNIWQHLPLSATARIGDILYRYL
jgi:lipid II:glycine glycyltransferase (peptidoglycan interpeptide bridge formation enzyme)